jgi:hypothetical protein
LARGSLPVALQSQEFVCRLYRIQLGILFLRPAGSLNIYLVFLPSEPKNEQSAAYHIGAPLVISPLTACGLAK